MWKSPLALAGSVLICFGSWYWVRHVFVPAKTAEAVSESRPVGNNSDLYPRWLGTRAILLEGRNPYSAEVTREIEIGYYGRELDPARPHDPDDKQAFAYPLYLVFLLAPVARVPFSELMPVAGWFLLLCLAASVPLWMNGLGLRLSGLNAVIAIALTLGTYAVMQGYYKQQLTLLVAVLLAGATAAIRWRWFVLAGALLAVATIKPQLAAPFVVWFAIWVSGEWRSRQKLAWSFVGAMVVLVVAAQILFPRWIPEFLRSLGDYQRYGADASILEVFFGRVGGILVSAGLVVFAIVKLWRTRSAAAGSAEFRWAVAAVASLGLVILPKLAAYNQVLLVPAILALAAVHERLGTANVIARAMERGAFACLAWQWLAASVIALASLMVPVSRLAWASEIPLYTLFAIPPVTLAAILLASPGAGSRSPKSS